MSDNRYWYGTGTAIDLGLRDDDTAVVQYDFEQLRAGAFIGYLIPGHVAPGAGNGQPGLISDIRTAGAAGTKFAATSAAIAALQDCKRTPFVQQRLDFCPQSREPESPAPLIYSRSLKVGTSFSSNPELREGEPAFFL